MLTIVLEGLSFLCILACWLMLLRYYLIVATYRNYPLDRPELCYLRLFGAVLFTLINIASTWWLCCRLGSESQSISQNRNDWINLVLWTSACAVVSFSSSLSHDLATQQDCRNKKSIGWLMSLNGITFVKDSLVKRSAINRIFGTKYFIPGIKIYHEGFYGEDGMHLNATLVVKATEGTNDFPLASWMAYEQFEGMLKSLVDQNKGQLEIEDALRNFQSSFSNEVKVEVNNVRLVPKSIKLNVGVNPTK